MMAMHRVHNVIRMTVLHVSFMCCAYPMGMGD